MSKTKTLEDKLITRDRMRFVKNKSSANLVYLAIILDVLFFVSVFKTDLYFLKLYPSYSIRNSPSFAPYYNILICGVSVVYNLAFMLAAFLASEGLKNYGKNYSYLAAVIGLVQIARIFIIPLRYSNPDIKNLEITKDAFVPIMAGGQATRCIIYLAVSGACLIAAAVINFIKCSELEAHMKSLESGKA